MGDVWSQPLKGNFNQLKKLKARHPQLKVFISLGGWTWSKNFSRFSMTAASRQTLVASCIDLYIKGNLPVADGAGGPGAAAGVFDGTLTSTTNAFQRPPRAWSLPALPALATWAVPRPTSLMTILPSRTWIVSSFSAAFFQPVRSLPLKRSC